MARSLSSHQITEGPIWKQLLIFFIPIVLGTFFQQMYNTVDTIIVGRFVGTPALAAVGATTPLVNLINGFFIGLSTGGSVIIAQFYGAHDHRGVDDALHTGMAFSLVLGLLTTLFGVGGGPAVLRLIKTPATCIDDAIIYTQIYFGGAIFTLLYNIGAGILRAMGDSKRPVYFLIVACLVNIAADLLFVVVFKMGVAGAALATVLSQAVSAVLVLIVLLRLPDDYRFQLKKLHFNPHLLRNMLIIGLPAGLQCITFELANLLIQFGINSFGDVTVAAWTAYTKTDGITWMVSSALGISATTFVGQNFGAQKYHRIRQSVWICLGMGVAMQITISTILLVLRYFILGIYTTDAEVIRVGAIIMMSIMPFNFTYVPVEVFSGTMMGTGYSLMPAIITTSCACFSRVAWVLLIVSRWHSVAVLAASYPISWVIASTFFFIAYFRGTWLRRRIEVNGLEPEVR